MSASEGDAGDVRAAFADLRQRATKDDVVLVLLLTGQRIRRRG